MEKRIILSKPQNQVLNSNKRIVAFIGGTGCGKSFIGAYWSLKMLDKGDGLIVAPSYPMLIRSTQKRFFEAIKGTVLEGDYNEQKKLYVSANGNIIYFGSADNPLSLDGPHVDWVWLDEAGICSVATFEILLSRISAKNGRILITTTPNLVKTRNWIYSELYSNRDKEYIDYIKSISIDNPSYSKEAFEFLKKVLDERTFSIRHLGEFIRSSALVYYEILDRIFIPAFELDESWERIVAIDPGVKYGVLFLAYKDGTIIIYNEFKSLGTKVLTAKDIAKEIYIREKNFKKIVYDPARILDAKNLIEELKAYNISANLYAPNVKNVNEGINLVIEQAKNDRLFIFNNLKMIKDEIESYHRPVDEAGQILDENPVKEDDDLLDCLRYGVVFLRKKSIIGGVYIEPQTYTVAKSKLEQFIREKKGGI